MLPKPVPRVMVPLRGAADIEADEDDVAVAAAAAAAATTITTVRRRYPPTTLLAARPSPTPRKPSAGAVCRGISS